MSNKLSAFSIAAIGLLAVAIFYFQYASKKNKEEQAVYSENIEKSNSENNQKTIASTWQWTSEQVKQYDDKNTTNAAIESSDLPFTPEAVYRALQAVKIDTNGNIVLDHDALISLDETVERIYSRLDLESTTELLTLIKESLPGTPGEQTAKLVNDYAQFLSAKEEFSNLYENSFPVANEQTVDSINNDQILYGELQSLRESYLGKEATDQLFRISDANATYMFESLKLSVDQTLTDAEKQQRQEIIQQKHTEQSVNITDWSQRYADFISAKDTIINAAISEDEKRKQLSDLFEEQFNSDERSRIEHLQLDKI